MTIKMPSKFLSSVLLCSDINLKTLLNIVPYDDSHILITCSSFIKRFNIEDRKQVDSWITKSWYPFTCGAVKDPSSNEIYTVINQKSLIHWDIQEKDIESASRSAFTSLIHSLEVHSGHIYIVYEHGCVQELQKALAERKVKQNQFLHDGDSIIGAQILNRNTAVILSKTKKKEQFCYKIQINEGDVLQQIPLRMDNCSISGCSFLSFGQLVTSWSDGRIFSLKLISKKSDSESDFPGVFKGSIHFLEPTKKLNILELSRDHIVLHGMNHDKEGGVLSLWDYKFGVSLGFKPLKMYSDPPRSWRIPGGVVVVDGGGLVHVPVHLTTSTVASMVGCRTAAISKSSFADESVRWVSSEQEDVDVPATAIQSVLSNKSIELSTIIEKLNLNMSSSENMLVENLINFLIEQKNIKLILESLLTIKIFPEKCLVVILKFFIELPEEELKKNRLLTSQTTDEVDQKNKKNGKTPKKKKNEKLNSSMNGISEETILDYEKEPSPMFSEAKSNLINIVLKQPFSESEMSKHVFLLDFRQCLTLLKYTHYLLSTSRFLLLQKNLSNFPSIENISMWLSFIVDAHFQQFVMTSELQVQKDLLSCSTDISALQDFLDSSQTIETLVERILAAKSMPKSYNVLPYSIEKIVL